MANKVALSDKVAVFNLKPGDRCLIENKVCIITDQTREGTMKTPLVVVCELYTGRIFTVRRLQIVQKAD